MEQRRRTRSQGPPSLPDSNELIQWDSIPDPVRIERGQVETCRLTTQAKSPTSASRIMIKSSEISQERVSPRQSVENCPREGEILPEVREARNDGHNTLARSRQICRKALTRDGMHIGWAVSCWENHSKRLIQWPGERDQ